MVAGERIIFVGFLYLWVKELKLSIIFKMVEVNMCNKYKLCLVDESGNLCYMLVRFTIICGIGICEIFSGDFWIRWGIVKNI